jgi:hypothetical protein
MVRVAQPRGSLRMISPLLVAVLVIAATWDRVALVSRARRTRPRMPASLIRRLPWRPRCPAQVAGGPNRGRPPLSSPPPCLPAYAASYLICHDRRAAICHRALLVLSALRRVQTRRPSRSGDRRTGTLPVVPSLQFHARLSDCVSSRRAAVGSYACTASGDAPGHLPALARRDGAVRCALQRCEHVCGRACCWDARLLSRAACCFASVRFKVAAYARRSFSQLVLTLATPMFLRDVEPVLISRPASSRISPAVVATRAWGILRQFVAVSAVHAVGAVSRMAPRLRAALPLRAPAPRSAPRSAPREAMTRS